MTHPNNKQLLAQLYNHIGETLLLDNQLKEATDYFNLGLLTAKEGNSKLAQSRSHFNLSKIYELQQKYALALIEFKLFNQINDSINAVLKTQSISDLQAKFDNVTMTKELHLKDLEVEKSQIEILESKLEVQNQSFQKKLIIGGLAIVLLFGLILLFAFRKQKQLNIKLDQLSIVAREIENTVIITDKDGEIEWINDSYKRKYGLNIDEFKKKYGGNIIRNSSDETIKKEVDFALKEKKTVQYYITNIDKNGQENHLRTTLTPTLDEDGNIHKVILIDTDITDIIQAEKQVTKHRDELQHVYTQVSESIDYALRIQEAILPHPSKISKFFKEYFLYYNPKDIVSGDFYFIEETEKYVYFAGADCTGHGVPGALMSVICHNLLENAVHRGKENTDEILVELNKQIIKKLRQGNDVDENIKDGLDIALCRISKADLDKDVKTLQYSGAHSGIYLIRDGELKEVKPDRVHLGTEFDENNISRNEISVESGTEIIMFSDGFADQKGFQTNKKFYYKPFRDLMIEVADLDSTQKSDFLDDRFQKWKGNLRQADDVFVWGLKI
jgi:PAS domain S-box-containing protein